MCSLNFKSARTVHALISSRSLHALSGPGLITSPRFWSERTYSADKAKPQFDIDDDGAHEQRPSEADTGQGETSQLEPQPQKPPRNDAVRPSKNSNSSDIIRRLQQLSTTDVSRLEPATPQPNPDNQFDPRILKMVKARNRVKGQGGNRSFNRDNYDDNGADQFGDLPNDASSYNFLKRHNIRTSFAHKPVVPQRKSRNHADVDDDRYD